MLRLACVTKQGIEFKSPLTNELLPSVVFLVISAYCTLSLAKKHMLFGLLSIGLGDGVSDLSFLNSWDL